jgi:hypothetical protein
LRRFPVWFDFRGNSSVLLSQAKALSTAAKLRGDLQAEDLAQKQAQWILGRNPFSTSLMYGEGYDWTPLYSVRSGQMVGALPVGIETREYNDAPYWPHQICWTYKEVWTQPVGEWIWLMEDLHGASVVEGVADVNSREAIEFRDVKTGRVTSVFPGVSNGKFRAQLPEGKYTVQQGTTHTTLTAVSSGVYHLDLRATLAFDFHVTADTSQAHYVAIGIHAEGAGPHTIEIRTSNLDFSEAATEKIELQPGKDMELTRHGRIVNPSTPWVVVVIADQSLDGHQEVSGVDTTQK